MLSVHERVLMCVLIWADRWLHRVMRGRCYNPSLCLKLSYYQATHVWLTEPLPEGRKGIVFHPRKRRMWTLNIKGYPVVRMFGRVKKE